MNLNRMFKEMRFASVGLLALAMSNIGSAVALPISFTVLDSDIGVGEVFEVEVSANFDSLLDLSSFAFLVDPFNMLPGSGVLAFKDWSLGPKMLVPFLPTEGLVEGFGDPFDPVMGGNDVLLATLRFDAIGSGAQNVAISGLGADFLGASLYDLSADESIEFDIDSSFDVQVSVGGASEVPDSSATGGLMALALGVLLVGRRLRRK